MKITINIGDLDRTTARLKTLIRKKVEQAPRVRRGGSPRHVDPDDPECICRFPARVAGGRCSACGQPCPLPGGMVPSSFVVTADVDHIAVYPGREYSCDTCADPASRFRRCGTCHTATKRCSGHSDLPKTCC